MLNLKEINLKKVIADIIVGSSKVASVQNLAERPIDVYVRHFNLLDQVEIESVYESKYNEAIAEGIFTEKQQLEYLISEGLWSREKDRDIQDKQLYIDNLKKTRSSGAYLRQHQEELDKQIKQAEKELSAIQIQRVDLIGETAETLASKKTNDLFLFLSVFKDKKLEQPLFTEEQFNSLDDDQVIALNRINLEISARLSEKELKRAAISPYFLNFFNLSDSNPQMYYGRPCSLLTFYQAKLFGLGCHFRNILPEVGDITEEMYDDPDKLTDKYEANKNIKEILDKSDARTKGDFVATSIVGMKKEDQKGLNLEGPAKGASQDLLLEKARKQGKVSLREMIELNGD